MKQIRITNYIFAVLQGIWLLLFFSARIWSFAATIDDEAGRFIRNEVGIFFFHAGTVLAVWGAAYDDASKMRWRFLIPLIAVQLINGIFTVLTVGIYNSDRPPMYPLHEFVLYGLGVYQLIILGMSLCYYVYHAWAIWRRHKEKKKKEKNKEEKETPLLPLPKKNW